MSLICKWMKSCFHMKGLAPRLVLRKRLKEIRTWPYLHMLLFSITDFVIGLKISPHFHSQLKLNQNQSWLAHRAHCVADTHCCGHIVADTLLPMMLLGLRKLGNICRGHKMFLNKIRNIYCVPDTKFVSATNVARAGKQGNICVGNNVSSFAWAYTRFPALCISYWCESVWFIGLSSVIVPVIFFDLLFRHWIDNRCKPSSCRSNAKPTQWELHSTLLELLIDQCQKQHGSHSVQLHHNTKFPRAPLVSLCFVHTTPEN